MPRRNGARPGRNAGSAAMCRTFGIPAPPTYFPPPLGRPKFTRNGKRVR
jgi:hypothetical protein